MQHATNISWVYVDVLIDPIVGSKGDIISFYNAVYLEKMKIYILATKNMQLEQGARTPVMTKSNFEALLTPSSRVIKPLIRGLCPLTPLIDQLDSNKKNPKLIFAQAPLQQSGPPNQTPRTRILFARDEATSGIEQIG